MANGKKKKNDGSSQESTPKQAINAPPPLVLPPFPVQPATAPSSSNNVRAITPGPQYRPGNPGTFAEASKIINSRVIDATKIYNGGVDQNLPKKPGASQAEMASYPEGAPSIVEQTRALQNNPQLIFEFVYDNVDWQPGWGLMKGPLGCLMDQSGNAFDQCSLLVALLTQAGYTANFVLGQIQLTTTQYDAWFGTNSTTYPNCCYSYAQTANIPCDAPVESGDVWTMIMSHVWVQVVVSGNTYVLDPSYKTYTYKSPVSNLATILGYTQSSFLSDAESGSSTDGTNYVANMNTTLIRQDLQTMTENLVTYINENTVGSAPPGTATVDDVLGGKSIVPITLPFTWETSLSYQYSVEDTWSAIPLSYKTTLHVQYLETSPGVFAIDQTFTSDQLAGGRLTLTFELESGEYYPVLTLNGTVVQLSTTYQAPGWNSALLTVTHNAYTYTYPSWWQQFIYAGQYYLIANAWGNLGNGQLTFHQNQLAATLASSSATNEAINGEWLSNLWFNWATQYSRMSDLAGRINNTYMNLYHQVGIVSLYFTDGIPSPGTDLGGIAGASSTLNYDFTQPPITNTITGTHGVALEAAVTAQFNGIPPGISTTAVIDKANRTATITFGGTVTVGDTLTITVHDPALSGGSRSDSYTVVTGDTPTSIAANLSNLMNADTNLSAIGVTTTSSGPVLQVSSTSINQTSYSYSTNTGATETITIAFSRIYLANPTNWNTGFDVESYLAANGYSSASLSTIGGYATTTGESVLIGDQPYNVLGQFIGEGYWVFYQYSSGGGALGLIDNTGKGGEGQNGDGQQGKTSQTGDNQGQQDKSNEPIGMFSGAYFYNRTDMTLGSQPFPYDLEFRRTYNSANQYVYGTLGWGWTHNHNITATIGNDGLLAMGEQFAVQGAATIAELYVSINLASDSTQPIAKLVTMTLADKWWLDQLVNNTVIVAFADGNQIFVKQPNGSHTAPAYLPSTLTLAGGAYTLTTPQGVKYNFNSSGQISSWAFPNGVTISYTYSSGVLSTISNGMGRALTLHYTSGRISSVTDGTGRQIYYDYDSNNDLTLFYDALSHPITYYYDQPGRMTQFYLPANPDTAFITNVYDSLSRVKTQADANSPPHVWTYYFAGSRSEEVDPLGNSRVLYFNSHGSTTREINALGFETDTVYDGLNRIVQVTFPEENQILAIYDLNNNILNWTAVPKPGSGLSNVVQAFTYDSTWAKLKTYTDPNLNTTTLSYDPLYSNLLTIQRPLISGLTPTVNIFWNGRGQPLSLIDETGVQTQLNYDTATEKLTSTVVNTNWSATVGGTATTGDNLSLTAHDSRLSGGAQTVSYTVMSGDTLTTIATHLTAAVNATSALAAIGIVAYSSGPIISLATGSGNTTTWTESSSGTETITLASGLNLTTSYSFDSVGNCNGITDPNENTTTFVSDAERRLTQQTQPTPFSYLANLTYDASNNLLQVQFQINTSNWQIYSATYSVTNKPLTFVDPLNYTTALTYDGADRLQTLTDPQSREWQYAYDALNRINQVTDPTGTICDTRTFTNNGYLASIKDGRSNVTQATYDGLDRIDKVNFADMTFQQNSSYDANGNVLTFLTRSGNSIVIAYDVLNRLSTKTPGGQPEVSLSYDLAGRLLQTSKPVVSGDPSSGALLFFYDTAGRFYQEEYPDGKTIIHVLDSNGNRTKTTWPDGYYVTRTFDQLNRLTNIYLNGSASTAAAFSYDELSRRVLLSLGNGANIDYAYTLNNDLTELTHSFFGAYQRYDYAYNKVHEIVGTTVSNQSFMWEPSAALATSYGTVSVPGGDDVNKYLAVGGIAYSYDGNMNLTNNGVWTFGFDTEDQLLTASTTGTSASFVYDPMNRQSQKTVNSTETRYIYSVWQRIADYNGSTGALQNRYVYGTGLDEPLIAVSSSGGLTFLHSDDIGSVIATSNSSGVAANTNAFSPFGEISTLAGTTFGFTGQRFDSETGLSYYKNRYYAPVLGRFLQPDPIGYTAEDFNLYTYVGNSPLKYVDPFGLQYGYTSTTTPGNQSHTGTAGGGKDSASATTPAVTTTTAGFRTGTTTSSQSTSTGGSTGPKYVQTINYPPSTVLQAVPGPLPPPNPIPTTTITGGSGTVTGRIINNGQNNGGNTTGTGGQVSGQNVTGKIINKNKPQ